MEPKPDLWKLTRDFAHSFDPATSQALANHLWDAYKAAEEHAKMADPVLDAIKTARTAYSVAAYGTPYPCTDEVKEDTLYGNLLQAQSQRTDQLLKQVPALVEFRSLWSALEARGSEAAQEEEIEDPFDNE